MENGAMYDDSNKACPHSMVFPILVDSEPADADQDRLSEIPQFLREAFSLRYFSETHNVVLLFLLNFNIFDTQLFKKKTLATYLFKENLQFILFLLEIKRMASLTNFHFLCSIS
jgi:hypothetical protein